MYPSDIFYGLEHQSSEYAILGMLSLRPMLGYDIRKTVHESIRYFWSESYGQIYPALKRLESQKLVERARGAQKGRAGRQVYALTPAGLRELQEWLTRQPQMQPFRNELLLKLFFGRLAPRETCRSTYGISGRVRKIFCAPTARWSTGCTRSMSGILICLFG